MPSRIIKDSIKTSKKINALSDFQFRLWVHLIVSADDYGRGFADPELVKNLVFPRRNRVTESDVGKALSKLAGMGCISLYEVDGESYFCFPRWSDHQRIQTKVSKFPAPVENEAIQCNQPCSTVSHGDSPSESRIQNPELITPYTPPSGGDSGDDGAFESFWAAYPRHVAKDKARTAFGKVPKSEIPELMAALEKHKRSDQWTKDGGQFIPHPATWLNQKRWQGDAPPAGKGKRTEYAQHAVETVDFSHLMADLGGE